MEQNAGDIIYYHSKLFKYCKLELLSTIGYVYNSTVVAASRGSFPRSCGATSVLRTTGTPQGADQTVY